MGKLDKAIKQAVQDTVEEVVEEKLQEASEPDEELYTNLADQEEQDIIDTISKQIKKNKLKNTPELKRIGQFFPSSEGYYGVLCKKSDSGKETIVYHIENLDEIDDLELYIYKLVKDRGWPDGDYVLRVQLHGQGGIKRRFEIPIGNLDKEKENKNNNQSQDFTKTVSEFADVVKTAKDIFQPNPQNNDPGKLTDIIANTFSKAIDLTKDNTKTGNSDLIQLFTVMIDKLQNAKKEDTGELIHKLVEVIKPAFEKKEDFFDSLKKAKDVGLIPEPKKDEPKESEEDKLVRLLTIIEKFQQKKEEKIDPLDYLIKLKQAGLIPEPKPEPNPMEQFEKYVEILSSLVTVTQSLGGGSSSFGIELIKTLGPQVPKIIENVTGTMNNFIDFSKKKLEAKGITTQVPVQERIVNSPQVVKEISQSVQYSNQVNNNVNQSGEKNMGTETILKEIQDAIDSRDKKFYPRLTEILHTYVQGGDVIYQDLKSGKISIDQIIQMLTLYGGSYFAQPKVRIYFQEYVNAIKNEYEIKCKKCNESYIYESKDVFLNEPKKICEVCGAVLEE